MLLEPRGLGLQCRNPLVAGQPGADAQIEVTRFFTVMGSGTRWKNSRGPTPFGSWQAHADLCWSSGSEASSSSHDS